MKPLILAGIDPSLRNLGMAKFEYEDGKLYPIEEGLQVTKPESKKAKIRKNCDDLNAAILLHEALQDFICDCDYVFMELPVGSQTARAMASYGICVGLAASIAPPLILVLPHEVKLITGLGKTASKAAMIAWAVKKYPEIEWLRERGKPTGKLIAANEHIADAVAATEAGINTDEFRRVIVLHEKLKGAYP